MCGVASAWKVIESAPALANSSMWSSGRSIIRWTSIAPPAWWTWSEIELATSGPIVIGGTKWPSITSTWMIRAPAAMTSSTCAPRREKSAERIEGATRLLAVELPTRGGGPVGGGFHEAAQMLRNIESPQCWHCMSSVRLMRAIVWCSPQFGHWETSSKRRRQ